jgi:uncharacterized membrane protein YdjX (TVP38/TMEM64 family)
MSTFLKPVLIMALVLAVPIIPFLLLGEEFEASVADWVRRDMSPGVRASLVVCVLATDIFLPVPASAVSTWAGGVLGWGPGVIASWLGMTLGAAIGFGLSRAFGNRFARRFAADRDLSGLRSTTRRFGPLALMITRALPILAEACVLLVGATRLSWRRFLWPVALGNLIVSVVYCACGAISREYDSLLPAAVISGMIPLLAALVARRSLWDRPEASTE